MTTLESQLRSALAEEAGDAPTVPRLAERVRVDADRAARRRRVRTSALGVGVAATVAAIAVLPSLRAGPPPPTFGPCTPAATASRTDPAAGAVAALCPAQDNALADPGHLPADLGRVTAGYTCWTGTHAVPGAGTWAFREVRRVTGGLEATLRAYAVPDHPENTAGCVDRGYVPKVLVVEVDGRFVAARQPVVACGAPLKTAVAAYEAMTTVVVSSVRLQQIDSPLSTASGCPQQVKDTIALLPRMQGPRPSTRPAVLPAAQTVTACVYNAGPDLAGTLGAATRLTSAEYDQVRALVGSATVDKACATTPHTRFAVLSSGSGLPWTEIALDGCGVDQGSGVLRAPAKLQTLLLAALKHQIVVG